MQEQVKKRNCPNCFSLNFSTFKTVVNNNNFYQIAKCNECRFAYVGLAEKVREQQGKDN
jgi:hypothetical protein